MRKAAVVLAVAGMLALTGCTDPMQEEHQRQMELMDACLRDGGDFEFDNKGGGSPKITCTKRN